VLRKAIFLDRDGVLNKPKIVNGRPFAPTKLEDFILYDEVVEIINNFKKHFYKIIVVTNQKDVGKGIISMNVLERMHKILLKSLPIDEIKVCTCIDECDCYKPNPGMLLEAKNKWKLNLKECYIIGDSWRDIGAGYNAGCKTILIDRKYKMPMLYRPDFIVKSLKEAEKKVLNL
tara:strand:- start:35476 stop:35997 length:522 start_codon:yes stop_codon:yes gene_type:complete